MENLFALIIRYLCYQIMVFNGIVIQTVYMGYHITMVLLYIEAFVFYQPPFKSRFYKFFCTFLLYFHAAEPEELFILLSISLGIFYEFCSQTDYHIVSQHQFGFQYMMIINSLFFLCYFINCFGCEIMAKGIYS